MGKRWGSALIPRFLVRPRNHPFQGDKLSPWQTACRVSWNWQDTRAGCQEILLANPPPRRRDLCPRMSRVSSFESRPLQALWGLTIAADANTLLKGLFDEFCHKITKFNQLEGRKLWLYPSYCWLAHKNGALWASQGYHQCSGASWSHFKCGSLAPWPLQFNRVG